MILLGVSILQHKAYASWTGILLVACPVLGLLAISFDGFGLFVHIPNILMSIAFIAIGLQAIHALASTPSPEGP